MSEFGTGTYGGGGHDSGGGLLATITVPDPPAITVATPARPSAVAHSGQAAPVTYVGTKYSGTGPPGTIAGAVAGDRYTDTVSGRVYERTVDPAGYLRCTGVALSAASCPDIAAFAGAVRLDITADVALDAWAGTTQTIVSQWGTLVDPSMSWGFYQVASGFPRLDIRNQATTPATQTYGANQALTGAAIRRTLTARWLTNTASPAHLGHLLADGLLNGAVASAGTGLQTGLRDAPARIVVGAMGDTMNNGNYLKGNVGRVVLRANDVVVASPDFTTVAPGATSFTDAQGNAWTLASAASIGSEPGYWRLIGAPY